MKNKPFTDFLKAHEIHAEFQENMNALNESLRFDRFIGKYDIYKPGNISGAFAWDKTKEGFKYWARLDIMWDKVCEEKK